MSRLLHLLFARLDGRQLGPEEFGGLRRVGQLEHGVEVVSGLEVVRGQQLCPQVVEGGIRGRRDFAFNNSAAVRVSGVLVSGGEAFEHRLG
ncbi:MAG: hypothetical protein U0996_04930 [Planctomycetaceae bacterium]